ncbi:uncharacterized protein LY89DRAFT_683692 [Mollisia scopiformis]|uniref:Uncharacterized protein n=1 Tax=Mollisia scopiformis TaxID=149040 RepID=A0A194XF83_MOLSC|nr:uncharacterized protein LY89DRAFT_683692 [Mollisia scopiformis]KUJ18828.1 hypothetical protein LY89DRAFT_683692 [Mollisia scopiformis]
MKLRKVGGKWWESPYDFEKAVEFKMRKMYPDEREVLYLGWPQEGGVWVLRFQS